MVFIYSIPNITYRSQKPRNTLTENAAHARPLSFIEFKNCDYWSVFFFFPFPLCGGILKLTAPCLCTWTTLVNKSCSRLCRLLIILLKVLSPGGRCWNGASASACVCICALVCKYRKRRRSVVQKFEVELSPRHLHKRTHVVVALSSC